MAHCVMHHRSAYANLILPISVLSHFTSDLPPMLDGAGINPDGTLAAFTGIKPFGPVLLNTLFEGLTSGWMDPSGKRCALIALTCV